MAQEQAVSEEELARQKLIEKVERIYFHKTYLDLGKVKIHYFFEHNRAVEEIADLISGKPKKDMVYIKKVNNLIKKDYWCKDTISELAYVGD